MLSTTIRIPIFFAIFPFFPERRRSVQVTCCGYSGKRIASTSALCASSTPASSTSRQKKTLLIQSPCPVSLQHLLDVPANSRKNLDARPLQDGLQFLGDGPTDHRVNVPLTQLGNPAEQIVAGQGKLQIAASYFSAVQQLDDQKKSCLVAHRRHARLPMRDCDLHDSSPLHLLRQNAAPLRRLVEFGIHQALFQIHLRRLRI